MFKCSQGHDFREISRRTVQETLEDVVYQKERIKHFDREGSEFWAEIEVPVITERDIEVEITELLCDSCGETRSVRLEKNKSGPA